jgi:hypothetical protein
MKKALLFAATAVVLLHFSPAQAQTQTLDNSAQANSNANSGSYSASGASSDQSQGQSQGQNQGQSQGQNQAQNLQSSQALQSSQGNAQNITFNSKSPDKLEVMANQNVPLAASVSFSSDYCSGTASGGVSTSLGFSLGGAKPVEDNNCQALRRAEKYSIISVTAKNMGYHDWAGKLMSMSIFELCRATRSDTPKGSGDPCVTVGLLGMSETPPAEAAASVKATPAQDAGDNPVQTTPVLSAAAVAFRP